MRVTMQVLHTKNNGPEADDYIDGAVTCDVTRPGELTDTARLLRSRLGVGTLPPIYGRAPGRVATLGSRLRRWATRVLGRRAPDAQADVTR